MNDEWNSIYEKIIKWITFLLECEASDTIHMSAKKAILLSCILYFFYDVLPAIYAIFCKSVCKYTLSHTYVKEVCVNVYFLTVEVCLSKTMCKKCARMYIYIHFVLL